MQVSIFVTKNLRQNGSIETLQDVRLIKASRTSFINGSEQEVASVQLDCHVGDKLTKKSFTFEGFLPEEAQNLLTILQKGQMDAIKERKEPEYTMSITDNTTDLSVDYSAPKKKITESHTFKKEDEFYLKQEENLESSSSTPSFVSNPEADFQDKVTKLYTLLKEVSTWITKNAKVVNPYNLKYFTIWDYSKILRECIGNIAKTPPNYAMKANEYLTYFNANFPISELVADEVLRRLIASGHAEDWMKVSHLDKGAMDTLGKKLPSNAETREREKVSSIIDSYVDSKEIDEYSKMSYWILGPKGYRGMEVNLKKWYALLVKEIAKYGDWLMKEKVITPNTVHGLSSLIAEMNKYMKSSSFAKLPKFTCGKIDSIYDSIQDLYCDISRVLSERERCDIDPNDNAHWHSEYNDTIYKANEFIQKVFSRS